MTKLSALLALLAPLSVSSLAAADDTTVVPATNTVVVVSQNAPTIVGAAPAAAPAAGPSAVAPVPAPQVADADVSQINGQLVPVGKHNEYRYKFKKTMIASNPIGWAVGFYGVSVSHALSNNIAIRGDANIIHKAFDSSSTGTEFGISAPIYLRRTYQGPFIEPGIIVRTMQNNCYDCSGSTTTQAGPSALVGYQATYDSGLSMAVAFGLHRDLAENDEYGDTILPAGYFRVGYAF